MEREKERERGREIAGRREFLWPHTKPKTKHPTRLWCPDYRDLRWQGDTFVPKLCLFEPTNNAENNARSVFGHWMPCNFPNSICVLSWKILEAVGIKLRTSLSWADFWPIGINLGNSFSSAILTLRGWVGNDLIRAPVNGSLKLFTRSLTVPDQFQIL